MKPYTIVIADDHTLIRQGLKTIIAREPSLRIVGEASNGLELLDFLRLTSAEMVILDIAMPHLNGLEAMEDIRKIRPDIGILMLTMHTNSQYFYQAISSGAHGYLMKEDSESELLCAIQTIREGKSYISPRLSADVTDEVMHAFRNQGKVPLVVLSDREKQVLELVVQGHSSKAIGKMLDLSPRTIDHHRASLLKKFQMKNTVDLVNYVVRNSFILPK
ncbi:response regulator transcription factor [Desulfobulbus rhabdoformis]|uniref:response regulator n=1 Tax=Desulfobulbus rhabdoformis TaxID=34032 RepID=UPI001964326C|nr:response regulator transcription factor [Desulfobulbus rhabdoformis]MBM9613399.1 response regulator transcription factor [Desulfobulbus rhabdoformis]